MFSEPEAVPVDPMQSIRDRAAKRKESGEVGGVREWFDIDYLLRVIDETGYEYNIQATDTDDGETWIYWESWQSVTEWLEGLLEVLNETAEEAGQTYKMVKRRKAGKVEEL